VDLRTDLVPGREFTLVRTELLRQPGADALEEKRTLASGAPVGAGVRVAEFAGLAAGEYLLNVLLEEADGTVLLQRPVELGLGESFAVTVLITRDCRGVVCGDEAASACLGGACVPAECRPGASEFCPPAECAENADCAAEMGTCVVPTCAGETCLYERSDSLCMDGEYCGASGECESRFLWAQSLVPELRRTVSISGLAFTATGRVVVGAGAAGAIDVGGDAVDGEGTGNYLMTLDGDDGRLVWGHRLEHWIGSLAARDQRLAMVFVENTSAERCPGGTTPMLPQVVTEEADGSFAELWSGAFCQSSSTLAVAAWAPEGDELILASGGVEADGWGCGPAPAGFHGAQVAILDSIDGACRWKIDMAGEIFPLAVAAADDLIVVAGGFYSNADFGGGRREGDGSFDAFVLALDRDGNHLWDRVTQSGHVEMAHSVAVDAERIYVAHGLLTAPASGAFPLAVIDRGTGAMLWGMPPRSMSVRQLALGSAGNLFVLGSGEGETTLLSFTPEGEERWRMGLASMPARVGGSAMAVTEGRVVVAGNYWEGAPDFGGGPLFYDASAPSTSGFVLQLVD